MALCSVVMVTYHTGPVLFASLKSVLRQQQLAELVLVDNGNPPDVLARLQQMALGEPRLKIITGQSNIGFAKACNMGAKRATGDYLLMLNPDCLLPPGALGDMMASFNEIPNAILAGCWLMNPDGTEQRGGRRQLLTPGTALSEAIGLHRFFKVKRLNQNHTAMPEQTHEVPAISGAFMCIRRNDYIRLFGLDEGYFLHVEDLDICMRVHRAGGKIICVPRVRVTHMLSTSGEVSSNFIEWQKARGFIRYFNKHFQEKTFPGLLQLAKLAIILRFGLRIVTGRLQRWWRREPVMAQTVAAKRLMILASGLAELTDNKDFEGKTVLVTGATSQIGLCVVRRLIASGAAVLALSRGDAIPYQHEQLRWLRGDLTDTSLNLDGYLVDIVVHCAPLWNLPPVMNLLAASEVKRVIAFSSTSIFAKAMSKNGYEKDVVDKLNKAETSIAVACDASNITWTIFRPTLIYGVGLDVNVTSLAKFIRRFSFFPVYPPAFGRRQPVHADDLAIAVLQSVYVQAACGKAYNVSGGEILTYRQMLERLFTLCRKKTRIVESTLLPFILDVAGVVLRKKHINGEIARRMNDDLIFFHDDAARDFGFTPRTFLSGGLKDIEGF
jgi:N-acetylglucosaminyl-diphospho-decaprenol L-rhamnosyltransferase